MSTLRFRPARTNGSALALQLGVCPDVPRRRLESRECRLSGQVRQYFATSSRGLELLDSKTRWSADVGVEGPDPAA